MLEAKLYSPHPKETPIKKKKKIGRFNFGYHPVAELGMIYLLFLIIHKINLNTFIVQ